jgi:hypothetical protein
MIEQITCDWCKSKLDPYKTELVLLAVDGTRYEMDCCKSCAKQVHDILKSMTKVARELEDVTPDMIHTPGRATTNTCADCGRSFEKPHGLAVHIRRMHKGA